MSDYQNLNKDGLKLAKDIPSLSIIVPSYNESERILPTLADIDEYITNASNSLFISVVVVNDGSLDNTADVVSNWIDQHSKNKKNFSLINYLPNKGKGYAIREGFSKADSDFVLYTDADGASPIEEIDKLLYWAQSGFDIVCGSRILKADNVKVEMGLKRRFTGLIFHLILKSFGLAEIKDTQCGFKLFKKNIAKKLVETQKCFNYSFDIEYLLLAKKYGYKIKEVPVNWSHMEGSKINLLRDSITMLLEVLKIRFIYKYN